MNAARGPTRQKISCQNNARLYDKGTKYRTSTSTEHFRPANGRCRRFEDVDCVTGTLDLHLLNRRGFQCQMSEPRGADPIMVTLRQVGEK